MKYLCLNELPPRTKSAVYEVFKIEGAGQYWAHSIGYWIHMLEHHQLYTDEIKLELFPFTFNEERP